MKDIVLTPKLCEVIGAFMGDWCIHNSKNSHYNIQFVGHKEHDIDYYNNVIFPVIS